MQLRKYRWSKDYESAEEELLTFFRIKQITTTRTALNQGDDVPQQTALDDIRLWCAEGSFITVVGDKRFSIQPGDALEIPSQSNWKMTVGMTGCVYYQAI